MWHRWHPYRETPQWFNHRHVNRRALKNAKSCYIVAYDKNRYKVLEGKYIPDTDLYGMPNSINVDAYATDINFVSGWAFGTKLSRFRINKYTKFRPLRSQLTKKYFAKFGLSSFLPIGHSETLVDYGTGCAFLQKSELGVPFRIAKTKNLAKTICYAMQ